jgi:hypothetical protein
MNALIEHKNVISTSKVRPATRNILNLCNGFAELGYTIEIFFASDIDKMEFKAEEPIAACIDTYNKIFKKLNIPGWSRESYPETLKHYFHREIGTCTLAEFFELVRDKQQLFVKPVGPEKLFHGFVYFLDDSPYQGLSNLDNTTLVHWSHPIDIITEYRVYVFENKIQNISRYRGSVDYQPDVKVIRKMIADYDNRPISYGLDVGITDTGKTILIEVNDSLALGNYGLPTAIHARMVEERWAELLGKSNRDFVLDSPAFIEKYLPYFS